MYALVAAAFVALLRYSATPNGRRLRWVLCALVLGAATYQGALMARDVGTGDGSTARLLVGMRYPALRIPPSDAATRFAATDRLAADFAQVYFPVRAGRPLTEAYARASVLDPWKRSSRFAPAVHAVCGWTICALPYGWAALAHLLAQLVLLAHGLVRAHRLLALPHARLATMATLAATCLLLAPVGLSWLERGQWSVYVGLGYLWLVLGLLLDRTRYVVAAAALAYLKWTSLPFMFVILSAHALAAGSLADFRRRCVPGLVFGVTFAALFACMPEAGLAFLGGVEHQETTSRANGLTFYAVLPWAVVKLSPLALVAIGALVLRKRHAADPALVPFAAGAAVFLLGYPSVAHDYSLPSLLGFVPLLAFWAGRVPAAIGALADAGFAFFLVTASWSAEVYGQPTSVIAAYACASLALGLLALPRVSEPIPARR